MKPAKLHCSYSHDSPRLVAAGPIGAGATSVRKNSNPSPSWGSSSREEYLSAESSIEKENGLLFASFSERLDLLSQDKGHQRQRRRRLKPAAAAQEKGSSRQDVVDEQKLSDRPFSQDTLNYVVKEMEAISITHDDDVFESSTNSPAVAGQPHATSTPNVVKAVARLSMSESLQSPLCRVSELIYRKGGKRWRRSVAAAAAPAPVTDNGRRATMMVHNSDSDISIPLCVI